jgi:hypothetical protein
MPHVERDSHAEAEQTLCEDDASLMQAWSEDGAALVRRRCSDDFYRVSIKSHLFYLSLLFKSSIFLSLFACQRSCKPM